MKAYLQRKNSDNDGILDVFDNFFKPMFYDEHLDSMRTDIKETDTAYELGMKDAFMLMRKFIL